MVLREPEDHTCRILRPPMEDSPDSEASSGSMVLKEQLDILRSCWNVPGRCQGFCASSFGLASVGACNGDDMPTERTVLSLWRDCWGNNSWNSSASGLLRALSAECERCGHLDADFSEAGIESSSHAHSATKEMNVFLQMACTDNAM